MYRVIEVPFLFLWLTCSVADDAPNAGAEALPEEWEARGFVPLALALANIEFVAARRHVRRDERQLHEARVLSWRRLAATLLAAPPDPLRAFFYSPTQRPHWTTQPFAASAPTPASHLPASPAAVATPQLAPVAPPKSDSDLLEDEVILFAPQAENNVAALLASSTDEAAAAPLSFHLPQMEAPPDDDDEDDELHHHFAPPPAAASSALSSSTRSSLWTPFDGSSFFTPITAPSNRSQEETDEAWSTVNNHTSSSFFGDLASAEALEPLEPSEEKQPPPPPQPQHFSSAAAFRSRNGRASVIQPVRQPRGPESGARGFAKRGGGTG